VFLAISLFGAEDPWTATRWKNPAGIEFRWRIVGPSSYRQGELIQVEVTFPGRPLRRDEHSDVQWQLIGVLLEPALECGTVEKPCMTPATRDPRFFPGPVTREGREPVTIPLNSYLPSLKPGRYQLAALGRKLVLTSRTRESVVFKYADPPVMALSNTVELEITEASEEWVELTVARCVRTLTGHEPRTNVEHERYRAAAYQLSFIDHPAAWRASLDLLPHEAGRLMSGLSSSGDQAGVCDLMRERLTAPRQAVSGYYIYQMIQICGRTELPSPPERSASKKNRATFFKLARAYTIDQNRKSYAELAAGLGRKEGEAKVAAMETLIRRVKSLRLNEPDEPTPEWIPVLRHVFVGSLPSLSDIHKRMMLEAFTGSFAWPELAPLCEALLDEWKPGDYYELPGVALRALHSVAPKRAQARVLKELLKPRTWLKVSHLELLPPDAVPPMDDELIEALARAQRPGGWSAALRMAALAKYATADALPRIRAIYESQLQPCQPELMAYFVRVDPEYVKKLLGREMLEMHAAPPPCAMDYIQPTASLAMAPVLENYIAAFLHRESVPARRAAARSLAQYGSASAEPPLWEAFREFHDTFQGDREPPTREEIALEAELSSAIAHGKNWLANEADLRLIESLCITRRCVEETQDSLRSWAGAPRIAAQWSANGISGRVAQYGGIKSLAEMKAKLAQFPRETHFVLDVRGPEARRIAADLKRFAGRQGFVITEIRR